MLDDETGLYLYGGFTDYVGADQHDSPLVFGVDGTTRFDEGFEQGEPIEYSINKDQEAYRELPKFKFYGELTKENFNFWVRYTRGGRHHTMGMDDVAKTTAGRLDNPRPLANYYQPGVGYQQLTAYTKYHQDVSDTLGLDYIFSYDFLDFERPYISTGTDQATSNKRFQWHYSSREDEYLFKIISKWNPHENHSVALGVERSWEIFGLKSIGFPGTSPSRSAFGKFNSMPRWSTTSDAIFGEYQWKWSDQIRTFWGMRIDKSNYIDEMKSPRAALIYTPNEKDTYKFMISRSVRAPMAARSRDNIDNDLERAKPEVLDSYEIRWERQQTEKLWLATSIFYNELEVIGFGGSTVGQTILGNQESWGIEFEATYSSDRLQVQFSHAYTKMIDFTLDNASISQVVSAHPYGYGNDFAMWSNHISKLYAKYKLDDKWSADGSMNFYWGFPGAKDFAEYWGPNQVDNDGDPQPRTTRTSGYNDPYGPSVFVNLGLEYKVADNLDLRIDGYNLLGFIDSELNKRLFLGNGSTTYRSHAPAFGLTMRYKF